MRMIVLVLVLLLTACATTGGISKEERARNEAAYNQEKSRLNAEWAAGKITGAHWSEEMHRIMKLYFGTTPAQDALLSYRTYLYEKLDAKQMTQAEAEMLYNQKRAELQAQDDAARRQAAAIMLMNMPRIQPATAQPYIPPPNPAINCVSNKVYGTVYTNCR